MQLDIETTVTKKLKKKYTYQKYGVEKNCYFIMLVLISVIIRTYQLVR